MSHETSTPGCFSPFAPIYRRITNFGRRRQRPESRAVRHTTSLPSTKQQPPTTSNPGKGKGILTSLDTGDSKDSLSPPPIYSPSATDSIPSLSSAVYQTIETRIDGLNADLRNLSLQIHDHPELSFKEKFAHDTLTKYMSNQGFTVTQHYLGLQTAFRASFKHGTNGPVIGINSEMDALPGIGHACGHNLIAIAGVGIALGIAAALVAHGIAGEVVLLGTPAEEDGAGKVLLIEKGGYADMDACFMCHPGPGQSGDFEIIKSFALQSLEVEYSGQTAHAGGAPWEGINALDAAVVAYTGISVLRQQIKPECRVHGIIEGKNWSSNIIPDYSKLSYTIRATTSDEVTQVVKRATACFEAAALATGCTQTMTHRIPYQELLQNPTLSQVFIQHATQQYNMTQINSGLMPGSTDFGNVSHVVPSLHPQFMMPAKNGNHTVEFRDAARTEEAHTATLRVVKSLAATGVLLCSDPDVLQQVKNTFTKSRSSQ